MLDFFQSASQSKINKVNEVEIKILLSQKLVDIEQLKNKFLKYVDSGDLQSVKTILKSKYRDELLKKGNAGLDALFHAAQNNDKKMMQLLLENKVGMINENCKLLTVVNVFEMMKVVQSHPIFGDRRIGVF